MDLPILSRLKDGETFDFLTLAQNIDQTQTFWDWWWEDRDLGVIARPEIIAPDDYILRETRNLPTVDLSLFSEFFDKTLWTAITECEMPSRSISRETFHESLLRLLARNSTPSPRPTIVFTGGGYGSGKTFTLNYLASQGIIPLKMGHMVGVDLFKMFIPEYNLIKAVADGRASLTVQKECQGLASELFDRLVDAGRSFMWDSSMSDESETLNRIAATRRKGYALSMLAVLTPQDVAIQQAMRRARTTRRFPNPVALPHSHFGFRKAFESYVPLFDEVRVITNFGTGPGGCYVVGEKTERSKPLAIYDQDLFSRALSH
jgi:hypothetical protein